MPIPRRIGCLKGFGSAGAFPRHWTPLVVPWAWGWHRHFTLHKATASGLVPTAYCPMYACMILYATMKRTALFLKEDQVKKLQKLSEKTGAPVAELVRRAVDNYLKERARELK